MLQDGWIEANVLENSVASQHEPKATAPVIGSREAAGVNDGVSETYL